MSYGYEMAADPRYGGAYDYETAMRYGGYAPALPVRQGGARKKGQRHVGASSESSSLTASSTPKFAYHAWHSDFKPVMVNAGKRVSRGVKHSQLTVHGASAFAAAKKVISHMHRASPAATEKAFTFIMTQQVKLRGGDQQGHPHTGTRIYHYQGVFRRFATPLSFVRGGRTVLVKGEPQVIQALLTGGQKRVMVPYVHHADVKAAYALLHAGKVKAARLVAAHSDAKLHRNLRAKHGLYRRKGPRKAKKSGGSSQADFYDVEPRYGGAGPQPQQFVDPYYYGVDPRVAGAYGFY